MGRRCSLSDLLAIPALFFPQVNEREVGLLSSRPSSYVNIEGECAFSTIGVTLSVSSIPHVKRPSPLRA